MNLEGQVKALNERLAEQPAVHQKEEGRLRRHYTDINAQLLEEFRTLKACMDGLQLRNATMVLDAL